MEYLRKNKKSLLMLVITLAVILVSSFFASMIQSAGYKVRVTDLRSETNKGALLDDAGNETDITVKGSVESGILFMPKDASKSNQKPAVVLTHGYLNNRELQLQNAIELARRGFIVLTVDREGHGNYEYKDGSMTYLEVYNAAKYLYNLPETDKSKIGVSGHSMGGASTEVTMLADSSNPMAANILAAVVGMDPAEMTQENGYKLGIVSAGLMQGWNPVVPNMTPFLYNTDVSVGILKAMDDEFFFQSKFADGTSSICREYLQSVGAATFVGASYTPGVNSSIDIKSGDIYVNGEIKSIKEGTASDKPFRVIYEANEIHPLNHFSCESAGYLTNFFYTAFGTPDGNNYIASGNQTWWIKEAFSTIGLAAFFFLIFPLVSCLLALPCFASLRKSDELDLDAGLGSIRKGGLGGITNTVCYFAGGLATMLFGGFIFRKAYGTWSKILVPQGEFWPQDTTGSVASWAMICAGFALLVLGIIWLVKAIVAKVSLNKGKEVIAATNPFACAKIDLISFVKTALLTLSVVGILYLIVWINWGIWTVDFRFWTLDVKPFLTGMIPTIFRYVPLFFIFYAVNAIGNAGFRLKDLPEWATIAINAFFNAAGVLLVILIQYITFRSTGVLWQSDMALGYIVVFPLVPVLVIATIISRQLYKKTGNIWLGAMINALLFTVITCANTAASFPYMF